MHDAQFTYDLVPLQYDTIKVGSGATITHDATNRNADLKFANTPTNGIVAMQSFDFYRYQPGKSQLIFVTFNMRGGDTSVIKFAGYSDGINGIEFVVDEFTPKFRILSGSDEGNEEVSQGSWNLDKMNGRGPSRVRLDLEKVQILVIDLQALYVGRVRIGFDLGGEIAYAHEFSHANIDEHVYIQTANLPVRVGMTCTDTVNAAEVDFICASVISEGGQEETGAYYFSVEGTATAGNNVDSLIVAIQPDTLFNGFVNRTKIILESIEVTVTGNNPVVWKLVVGQGLTGMAATEIDATYSATDKVTGIPSGAGVTVLQGYCPATTQNKAAITKPSSMKYPITLDHSGAITPMGRVVLLAKGVGGTSATRAIFNYKEIR